MTTKARKSESPGPPNEVSARADDWIRQFIEHFEKLLLDASRDLPPNAGASESQVPIARAILETFIDAGVEIESALEVLGKAALQHRLADVRWSDALNQRRFALIDREIQGTLTPAENIELAGLTRIMREDVESETNLPMQGARTLHRKLLQLKSKGEAD